MRAYAWVVVLGAAACEGQAVQAGGNAVYQAFTFKQDRQWTFAAKGLDYRLQARQSLEAEESDDGAQIFTVEYYYDCILEDSACTEAGREATKAFEWKLSSDLTRGVLFHENSGEVYDPPVKLSSGNALLNAQVTTESGGVTFTSTFAAQETCPAPSYWPDAANGGVCYKLVVDDGGAGSALAGSYWATPGFGIVAFTQGEAEWSMTCFHTADDGRPCR